jgi:zinc protease
VQQRGDAGLINHLPSLLGQVTEELVVAAAATLRPARRATIEVVPGGGK